MFSHPCWLLLRAARGKGRGVGSAVRHLGFLDNLEGDPEIFASVSCSANMILMIETASLHWLIVSIRGADIYIYIYNVLLTRPGYTVGTQ